MKFSICVPVYNVENYLQECLDSILCQTFQDFEVICINDGSTDKSFEILKQYEKRDKRIIVFDKKNSGLLWARRDAIKIANGEYVLFIDSDDKLFDECALESINKKLIEFNGPDLFLFDRVELINGVKCFTTKHFFDDDMIFANENIRDIRYIFITRNYFNSMFLKCVKTDLIKKDSTDYSLYNPQMGEDISQSIYLFNKSKTIVYSPLYIYCYRCNNSSITKSPIDIGHLEKQLIKNTFFEQYCLIEKWNLKTYFPNVYEKFFNKVYRYYCDLIFRLFSKKRKHEITKYILNFSWFNGTNIFLCDLNNLKKAKLSKTYFFMLKGIIKKNSVYIYTSLFLNWCYNFCICLKKKHKKYEK